MACVFGRNLFKKCVRWPYYLTKRNESLELQYDLSQEVTVTHYKTVLIVGINLPDVSNSLNDSALIKINETLKDFNISDKYSVAVLHGLGGNFCTGIQKSANMLYGEEIIKTMNELRKPTICSLTGTTKFFGFLLAIMCDFRIMEVNALLGLGYKQERGYLCPITRKKLIKITNLAAALEIALSNAPMSQSDCLSAGLTNKSVDIGAGLGKAINFATTIAKYPLDEIIEERSLIYSYIERSGK